MLCKSSTTLRTLHGRRSAFALVVTMMLITMLVTSGSALAILTSTDALRARHISRGIDHELAIKSLLVVLPELLKESREAVSTVSDNSQARIIQTQVVGCQMTLRVKRESGKFYIPANSDQASLITQLRHQAATHGLPYDALEPRPLSQKNKQEFKANWVWFDQLVASNRIDGVFHHSLPNSAEEDSSVSWSDLITFWPTASSSRYSLEIRTSFGHSNRYWYAIVDVSTDQADVIYCGGI